MSRSNIVGGGSTRALCRDRRRIRPAQGGCHRDVGDCRIIAAKQATSTIPIVFAMRPTRSAAA